MSEYEYIPEEVFQKITQKDQEAFEELYDLHKDFIFYLISEYVGKNDAEDVSSLVWTRVWNKFETIDAYKAYFHWIKKVAKNLAIDHLRRRKKSKLILHGCFSNICEEGSVELIQQSIDSENLEKLEKNIKELPKIYLEILQSRLEGLSCREIGIKHQIPKGTVFRRLFTGRNKLRKIIEQGLTSDENNVQ